jgi:hypothetical protein
MHWTNVTHGGFLTIHPNFLQTFPILHELPQYSKVFLFIFATIYTLGFFIMFLICSMNDKGIWRQCPYDDLPKRDSVMYVAKLQVEKWQFGKDFWIGKCTLSLPLTHLSGKKQASSLQRCLVLKLLIYKFVMI